jgi:hypothetical protein
MGQRGWKVSWKGEGYAKPEPKMRNSEYYGGDAGDHPSHFHSFFYFH